MPPWGTLQTNVSELISMQYIKQYLSNSLYNPSSGIVTWQAQTSLTAYASYTVSEMSLLNRPTVLSKANASLL